MNLKYHLYFEGALQMRKEDLFPRILVVDNELLVRSGIERFLQGKAAVETAASAEEALEAMRSRTFDLCLLDVFMPGMNGLDAMRKMKEIAPLTKVVLMTGSYLDETMKQTIKNEAYAFVEKPFAVSRILELVNEAFIPNHQYLTNTSPDFSWQNVPAKK